MSSHDKRSPFQLNVPVKGRWRNLLFSYLRPSLERVLSLNRLTEFYEELQSRGPSDEPFTRRALQTLNISYQVSPEDLERVPKEGRIVVVANHPFGGIEGVILADLLGGVRSDTKILANFILERVPELRDLFIFVDPFGSEASLRKNIQPLKQAISWLEGEGALGIFPAGTVSHLHLTDREIKDPAWSNTVARVIRHTQSPVLPVYFHGANGPFFQLMGLVHPRLRTALLPHELVNKANSTISLEIGSLISFDKISSFEDDNELLSYVRLRTYILGANSKGGTRPRRKSLFFSPQKRTLEPIVAGASPAMLLREVEALPSDQALLSNGEYTVYFAHAWQIPNILHEIGRLREMTFRKVGEGTGKSIDLDRFDSYYIHLFVWNMSAREVVGAYRIGKTDRIQEQYGIDGLYTSTLFAYKPELLGQIGPALELGRSFVRHEYQRSYSPLLLLWKGIGQFVVNNPRYKVLFGPVSINNDYETISRQIIVNFLKANDFLPELAKLVTPRNPMKAHPVFGSDPKTSSRVARDIDEVNELVAEIEEDRRGIPVLLRQYLKLGGKLLGFNVDESFGDVLDGLILVDLLQTEDKFLERYFTKEGAASLRRYHQNSGAAEGKTGDRRSGEDTPT